MELAIPMLQSIMEVSNIFALNGCQGPIALKVVILKGSLIDVAWKLQHSLLLRPILVLPFEVVVAADFLTIAMQHIVLEEAAEGDIAWAVASFSIPSAELDIALVVVSIAVDESPETMRKSIVESAFVIASVGVVIFAVAVGFAIVPLSFVDNASSIVLEESVGLSNSSLILQLSVALKFDGF